jgi:peroxiredoxin
MRQTITASLFTLLLAIFSPALCGAEMPFDSSVIKPKLRVKAPAFSLSLLDGSEVRLLDFKGKVVLINFWATWCAPCKEEMPSMERLWQKLKERGFVVIAINQDRGSPKAARKFSNRLGFSFPVLLDPAGTTRRTYEVTGLPTSYIIKRDGKILGKVIGTRAWDGAESIEFFERLLNKKSD